MNRLTNITLAALLLAPLAAFSAPERLNVLFIMIRNNQCPPYLFVGGGELIAGWITKNIAGSQARFIRFRWPHGFEFFDPAKDQLVIVIADYLHETRATSLKAP